MEVKNTYDIANDKIGKIYVGRRGFYGLVSKPTIKSTASKLQRMLNKTEKERVAEYVEEAKRLKETTAEFSYEL